MEWEVGARRHEAVLSRRELQSLTLERWLLPGELGPLLLEVPLSDGPGGCHPR